MLLFLVGGVRVVDTGLFRALWNFDVDGMVSTVLLVVADGCLSSLTPSVPCRYGLVWEKAPDGVVGVGARWRTYHVGRPHLWFTSARREDLSEVETTRANE